LSAGFGLPRFADCGLPNRAMWKQFGLITQAPCLVGKTLFQGLSMVEIPSLLHSANPFLGGRRERKPGVLITDGCRYRAVMKRPWSCGHFGAGQYCSHPQRINVLLTN
jgi:hypothetical protein